jgi:hypothetical protein
MGFFRKALVQALKPETAFLRLSPSCRVLPDQSCDGSEKPSTPLMESFALRHMKVKRTSRRDSSPDPTPLKVWLPLQRVPALITARPFFRAKRPWACPFRAFSSSRSRTRLRACTLLLFLVTPTSGDSDVTHQLQGFAPRWSPPPPVRFLHRRKAVALLGLTPSRVFSSRPDVPSGTPLVPSGLPQRA